MLGDITRGGVEQALAEFDDLGRDGFLTKYGFRPARSYFVVAGGRRYDSKAICGAAHGFDRPDEGPLSARAFSGGDATVARTLEGLGFEIERPTSNRSGWTSEERALALDLYLRAGNVGRDHPGVIALSEELNLRGFHPDAGKRSNFRNANGVAMKLANFAALDPMFPGAGMQAYSVGDEETWELYARDTDLLATAVAAIRAGGSVGPESGPAAANRAPVSRPIERRRVDAYELTRQLDPVLAERREALLVERFATWLRGQGATVRSHHYEVVRPPLRADLADETTGRIWEAKADVSRSSVRMALGQLLDYLRFEPAHWTGGVLVPIEPSDDLHELIFSAGRSLAWLTSEDSFEVEDPPR